MATNVHERTANFLNQAAQRSHVLTTPESVQLRVDIADAADRAGAFLIDLLGIVAAVVGLIFLVGLTFGFALLTREAKLVVTVTGFLVFAIRYCYFTIFELAWRGATPGKRAMRLRVIDRQGGALLPSAIITRNLTREVECFLPFFAALQLGMASGWTLAALIWTAIFGLMPLWNRERRRVGDMLAGTIVMKVKKRALLPDLAEEAATYQFTDAQLRQYGAFELQVLEEVLRRPPSPDTRQLLEDICTRVTTRLAWPTPIVAWHAEGFLRDFYAAQRAHLEREQLYGRGRETKHDVTGNAQKIA